MPPFHVLITKNMKADEHLEKPLNEGTAVVKCPQCKHEFRCEPGWQKISAFLACPNCGELIRMRKIETNMT